MITCIDGGAATQVFGYFLVRVCRYDSRVKAMEVDERPTEQYSDIGGLDKQIQEVSLYFVA